jgi:hypothetical protein
MNTVYLSLPHIALLNRESFPLDVGDLKGRGVTLERHCDAGGDTVARLKMFSVALLAFISALPLLPLFFLNLFSELHRMPSQYLPPKVSLPLQTWLIFNL